MAEREAPALRETAVRRAPALREYAYGRFLVRYRWPILVLCLLAAFACAAGTRHLTDNPDSRVFFSEDNPQLKALERFENTYSRNENVVYVLAPRDGDVFSARTMEAIDWLTEATWQTPYSQRVDSITNFQWSRADGDDLVVSDMYPGAGRATDADLDTARAVVLDRPTLVNRIVDEEGSVTSVNVTVVLPNADPDTMTQRERDAVPEIVAFTRARAAEFREAYPDIDLYLTGSVMFSIAFSEVPQEDMATRFPIMVLLILLIVGVSVRSVLWTVVALVSVVLTVVATLGVAGWLGVVLNAGTSGAPIIILTLAIAHSVHVMVTCEQQLREGFSKHDAIVESLRVNLPPVFVTSATTAIGFLSLNFSDAPPFRLLGNMVAGGVMIAFVLSLTLVPAAMAVLPARRRRGGRMAAHAMTGFSEFVIARRGILIWVSGAIIALLAIGTTRITLDDDFVKYFDDSFPIRIASDFAQERLTGLNVLEYSVPAGREGGVSEPEFLAGLERFAEWLRAQPNVRHVYALTDIVKRLNENLHGDDPAFYALPDSADLAAQYLLLYELSLPLGLDLNSTIDVGKSATRVSVSVVDMSSAEMRDLNARAEAWLAENVPALQTQGTGLSLMFSFISERNIESMLFGSLLALVLISFVLIVALRSVKVGLVSLVPNLFPAAMAFGLWGYLVGEVGLAIAFAAAVTLGIVVDDTVHFLSKYLRARREEGMDPVEATRYAFKTVGMALWVTSTCLVAGFLVMATSGFKVNADLALLSAVTISFALAADFLFLPPLLMKLEGRRR